MQKFQSAEVLLFRMNAAMHESLFVMAGDQTMTSASLDVFVATRHFAASYTFVFLGLTAAIGEDAAAHSYQCQYQAAILGAAFAC